MHKPGFFSHRPLQSIFLYCRKKFLMGEHFLSELQMYREHGRARWVLMSPTG